MLAGVSASIHRLGQGPGLELELELALKLDTRLFEEHGRALRLELETETAFEVKAFHSSMIFRLGEDGVLRKPVRGRTIIGYIMTKLTQPHQLHHIHLSNP